MVQFIRVDNGTNVLDTTLKGDIGQMAQSLLSLCGESVLILPECIKKDKAK